MSLYDNPIALGKDLSENEANVIHKAHKLYISLTMYTSKQVSLIGYIGQ